MELSFNNTFDLSVYGGKLFKPVSIRLATTVPLPIEAATPEGKAIHDLVAKDCAQVAEKFAKDKEAEYRKILLETEHNIYATAQKQLPHILEGAHGNSARAVSDWLDTRVSEAEGLIRNALATFESVFKTRLAEVWSDAAETVDKKFKSELRKKKILPAVKIGFAGLGVGAGAVVAIMALPALAAASVPVIVVGGLGVIKKIGAGLTTIFQTITRDWPRHATAAVAVEKAADSFRDALRDVETAAKMHSLGRPEAGAAKEKADKKARAEQAKLKASIHDLETWNKSLQQDVEASAKLVTELEKKLEGFEKQLLAEKDSKKAQDLRKACEATVKAMGNSLDTIELARVRLQAYEHIIAEANSLVDAKTCSAEAAGSLSASLARAAKSDEVKQIVTVGKVATVALAAVLDLADS